MVLHLLHYSWDPPKNLEREIPTTLPFFGSQSLSFHVSFSLFVSLFYNLSLYVTLLCSSLSPRRLPIFIAPHYLS